MRNLKMLFVATLLGLVLLVGQPHAVIAAQNSSHATPKLSLSGWDNSTADFSVTIDKITYLNDGAINNSTMSDDGTYHVISPGTSPITLARFFVSLTGYTEITNGTMDFRYGGQFFIINNGIVNVAGLSYASSTGVDIAMSASVNVISFLYVGYENTTAGVTSIKYASATAVIRVGTSEENIANTEFVTVSNVPVKVTATDAVDTTKRIDTSEFIASNWNSFYSQNPLYTPDMSGLKINYTDGAGAEYMSTGRQNAAIVQATNGATGSFEIYGSFDTTGFAGDQTKGWNITKLINNWYDADGKNLTDIYDGDATHQVVAGMAFWVDGSGVQMLQDGIKATLYASDSNTNIQSPIAIVAVTPNGYWNLDDSIYDGSIDWDGLFNSWSDFLYGTFDFGINAKTVIYGVVGSNNQIQATATTTVNGPGFTGLLAFFGVGLVAYYAPKMRKEE